MKKKKNLTLLYSPGGLNMKHVELGVFMLHQLVDSQWPRQMKPKRVFCFRLPLGRVRRNAALQLMLYYCPAWTGERAPRISPFLSFLKARIGVLTCSRGSFSSPTEIQTRGFGFGVCKPLPLCSYHWNVSCFFWLHVAGAACSHSNERVWRDSSFVTTLWNNF